MKKLSQIFGVITAVAAIVVAAYVVYQNWEKIRAFCEENCKKLPCFQRADEFADYVD